MKIKSARYELMAARARDRMQKNERLMEALNLQIKDLDPSVVQRGADYLKESDRR